MDAFIMQIDPLIQEVQSLFRKEAGISSFNHEDPSISDLPTISESISQFDPSPPQCRCHLCNARLLRDVKSLVCVYCGVEQKRDTPPDPLRYRDTLAFRWLLGALDLDGSEIVGPPIGADEVKNGNPTSKENLSISDLLDFEIKWHSESDKLQSKTRSYVSHFEASSSEFFLDRLGGSLSQPQGEKSLRNASGLSKMAASESVSGVKFHNSEIPSPFLSDETCSAADVSSAIDTAESVWEANFQSAAPLSDVASISISIHKNTVNKFDDGKAHKESKNDSNLPTTMSMCKTSDPVENTSSHTAESDIFLQEHQWQSSVADASEKNGGFEPNDSFYNLNDFNGSSSYIENYHDSYTKESFGFVSSNGKSVSEDLFKSDPNVVQVETSDRKLDLFSAVSNTQNDFVTIDNTHSKNLFMTSDSGGKVWDCISATKSGGDPPKVRKDAETLISEMHDLCFMLEQDLCIPSNPTKLS